MPFTAGQKLRASVLNRIPTAVYEGIQTGNGGGLQSFTTTETDLLACTVTFTTLTAARVVVHAVGHFLVQTGSAGILDTVVLNVDGTTITNPFMRCYASTSGVELTLGQVWNVQLGAAGSHTFKLRGLKSGAGGSSQTADLDTHFVAQVFEVV